MTNIVRLESKQDDSVNWVFPAKVGKFEARYVRRKDEYVSIYLSTHSGCNQKCNMCHLTATGQTQSAPATIGNLVKQAEVVLEHYKTQKPAEVVHFNFMARGEPLLSPYMMHQGSEVLANLANVCSYYDVKPKFLISTTMPKGIWTKELSDMFPVIQPEIYYSMYSTDPLFRAKWLPNAMPVHKALEKLAAWQYHSNKIIRIHHAYIAGENDSGLDVYGMVNAIQHHNLRVSFNIVRYNPYSADYGTESSDERIQHNIRILQEEFPESKVKVVTRVGQDVAASCGMFMR